VNIRDLAYFVKLTEIKNFSQVAQYFHVSQPTITFALQRLEKELDTTLLIRHRAHGDLLITPSGQQLLVHATNIVNEDQLLRQELQNQKQEKLLLGLPPIIENTYFPKIAKRLKEAKLLDRLQTFEEGSMTTLEALQAGTIDLALLGSVAPLNDPNLETVVFDQRPFAIYVARTHPLAKQPGVYFVDLKGEDFVLFKGGFIHNRAFNDLAKQNHFRPHVVFRSNGTQSLLNLIADGVGIGFLTTTILEQDADVVRVPLLDEQVPQFMTSLVYRRSHVFTPAQQQVVTTISETLRKTN
jgi:DNA-binding transcriptional LysR family regulator